MNRLEADLFKKIRNREALVAIIGVGYIGHELGRLIAKKGYRVLGFFRNAQKMEALQKENIPRFTATRKPEELSAADLIIISVSTLIDKQKKPDLRGLRYASILLQKHLGKGQLVILESTVSPGMTQKIFVEPLAKQGFRSGRDYFIGYSPNRIDPGNRRFTLRAIPKLVSGRDAPSLRLTQCFYDQIVDRTVRVSSIEAAEMAKMMENTVRFVLINLMNELQRVAVRQNIDLVEAIDAAATKPFGFFPVYPGAGVGGHCIPVNLHYLLEDAHANGIRCPIIEAALSFHEQRIRAIVDKAFQAAHKKHPRIFVLGMSIKPGSDNVACSVGLRMLHLIEKKGGRGAYHDPFVPGIEKWISQPLTRKTLQNQDVFIIVTDHPDVDWKKIALTAKPVIDPKNAMKQPGAIRI